MKKPGRNDPCPCGSGKKFKKCCENKLIGKKFRAENLTPSFSGQTKVTSLFQTSLSNQEQINSLQEKKIAPISSRITPSSSPSVEEGKPSSSKKWKESS